MPLRSLRSAPAQKARSPAPVRTTQRVSPPSRLRPSNSVMMSVPHCEFIALATSGRLRVTSMTCWRGRSMLKVAKDMAGTSVWLNHDERRRAMGQLIGRLGDGKTPAPRRTLRRDKSAVIISFRCWYFLGLGFGRWDMRHISVWVVEFIKLARAGGGFTRSPPNARSASRWSASTSIKPAAATSSPMPADCTRAADLACITRPRCGASAPAPRPCSIPARTNIKVSTCPARCSTSHEPRRRAPAGMIAT